MHDTHSIQVSDEVAFFKIHDLDGDGFWDTHELQAMYGLERDIDPSASHIRAIINRAFQDLDADQDNRISLQEYMQSKLPNWTPEERRQEKQWQDRHPVQEQQQQQEYHRTAEWVSHHEEESEGVPDKFRVQA